MIRAPKICGGSQIRAGLTGYVAELIPAMLAAFLESDKSFVRDREVRSRRPK
ncbi:MAG: DUF2274 domain-containing protein [Novosphingobium sp.]